MDPPTFCYYLRKNYVGVGFLLNTVHRNLFLCLFGSLQYLLVFMALGANLKISIFAPPGVRPA